MAVRPVPARGKRRPGAPTKLTPATVKKITNALEKGSYREVAARAAGIATSTFRDWMLQADKDLEAGLETPHTALREAVLTAEGKAEVDAVELIRDVAETDRTWTAAAWLLERKHPQRWGRKLRVEAESTHTVEASVEVVHSRVIEVVPADAVRVAVAEILSAALDPADRLQLGPGPNGTGDHA